ncbi:transport and Golgi organization protein 2 homolog [Ceratina calcarata]|uniref:Transport and Golgi organization protein 2 homolog n=1 Tax=Ceratina calcarata TaxID=156304 RepID=A0AAJ7S683_9HYME|nr:transport and Golgi organization protein 2 homolog [Ceratina calcarata]XP_026673950.1 transport and Golgi organization protein 2 homolog [Ceratina calcarata]
MCILFIYRNPNAASESYRLILASNRDEYLKRPSLPAHYWKDHPQCIGGTDMEPGKEGGTWLAVSLNGKAGIILNLTNEASVTNIPKQGRGFLVPNFVASKNSATSYLNKLHEENNKKQIYNPFVLVLVNLLTADVNYLSSSETSTGPDLAQENILGFSNSGLNIPFKKVEAGKEMFKTIIKDTKVSKQTDLIEKLLTFLKSKERYLPDPELERRCPVKYKELSSICVVTDGYGTRTHSILLVNGRNEMTFVEETLMPDLTWKRQVFNNKLLCET